MAAPKFTPVSPIGSFRDAEGLPPALEWTSDRPGEIVGKQPSGGKMGSPGPDQGYAIKLAHGFHGKLSLAAGEHEHDAIVGCLGVAMKRSSLFGRAPVIHDLNVAFNLFGFTSGANDELVKFRRNLFDACGHHYELQRAICDAVPESTLRMTPDAVKQAVSSGNWKTLF